MLLSPARGRGWVRGLPAVTQHQRNLSPDPFRVLNDMVRPETQDTPAFALHRGGAALVCFDLRSMMVAVVAWRTRTAPHA